MTKTEAKVLNKIYKFVNEQCLDLVADIVDIILQERKENHS